METHIMTNKDFIGLQIRHFPTLLIVRVSNKNTFTNSRGKFVFGPWLKMSIAKATKHFDMIITRLSIK